ncbi:MAG: T9SS type A sorting domain-containing protein, partial [candidate division WOR-3 bacterium]
YGTIAANGDTAQGTFQFTASSSIPGGTDIPMTVYLEANAGAYTTNCNFSIVVGEIASVDWASHDVGNCILTVTRYGAIGYMSTAQSQGDGFVYPSAGSNHLFYGSVAVGNDSSYCVDRYFGPVNDDTDWETTVSPDGMVRMIEPGPCLIDEYATASYDDSGHPAPKGLVCFQYSWAWDDPGAEDFVIIKFAMINEGAEMLNDVYAAVFMDWDVANYLNNQGSSDPARNLTWMYETTPYVGVAILDPPRTTPAANLVLIDHTVYVYPAGMPNDSIKFQFMDGTITNPSSTNPYDWSTCNSAGPFTLGPGESAVAAFAIIGGNNLGDLQANADTAYERYWNWPGVEEGGSEIVISGFKLYPVISRGAPHIVSYGFDKETPVQVRVYDITGRMVMSKDYGSRDGTGEIHLNLESVAQGIYFVQIQAGERVETKKIIRLK